MQTISAEEAGFDANKLDSLALFLEEAGSSSMMIFVDGKIAFEWGATDQKHTIHSIRKSMLNSLYGIKVAEGIIDTNHTLSELGIDDVFPLTEKEKEARVADLLRSRSGVYHPAAAVSDGMLRGMPGRGSHRPNEHYYYNNWDFNVLGAILEQQTGKSIYELYNEEIAQPLGMQDFNGEFETIYLTDEDVEIGFPQTDGFYQYEEKKSNYPAYHFRMSARDMALYGQLYLQNGNWNGKQIIPESWIEESTKPHSLYNPRFGIAYGMLWYVLAPTETRTSKSFYHTGTGVHMLGIYPASNLVLVHRVDTEEDYEFGEAEFYGMINRVWGARR
ncbi:MAG: beta-lactamase family protein [Balneolales bacterium]|nr:beta-lactamase family protein [Balneolales bacterium]